MYIKNYYKPSEIVDFARYINTTSSSTDLIKAHLVALLSAYNIYRVKESRFDKKINYNRYIKSCRSNRFDRFIRKNLATLEITFGVLGLFILGAV